MKLLPVSAFIISLSSVRGFLFAPVSSQDSLSERMLFRRTSDSSRSPPRKRPKGPINPSGSMGRTSPGPSRPESPPSDLRKIGNRQSPTPSISSHDDSDSSSGDPEKKRRAKVKISATGPGSLRIDGIVSEHLYPGQKFKKILRHRKAVTTEAKIFHWDPPGKAKMIMSGGKSVSTSIKPEGTGKFTELAPTLNKPVNVYSGSTLDQKSESRKEGSEPMRRFKSEIVGPGSIVAEAEEFPDWRERRWPRSLAT